MLLVAATLFAYLLFTGVRLGTQHLDPSRFIVAGDRFFAKAELTYPVYVESHSAGYDGQFYYRLALDPFTRKWIDHGITLDRSPVVRAQRIVYPLLAWTLTLGNGRLVPVMLVAINLVSVAVLTLIAVGLAAHFSISARLALLIPFYPGFVLSLSRDTVEILATALALGALLSALKGRYVVAALVASVAVLTRETTLLYLAGIGIVAAFRSVKARTVDGSAILCLVPVLVFVIWQIILRSIWGHLPVQDLGPHDLTSRPGVEYLTWLNNHWQAAFLQVHDRYRAIFTAISFSLLPVFVTFLLWQIARTRGGHTAIIIPWLMYVVMAVCFTGAIWDEPYGYLRILCDVYALGIAALVATRNSAALHRLIPAVLATWLGTVLYVL